MKKFLWLFLSFAIFCAPYAQAQTVDFSPSDYNKKLFGEHTYLPLEPYWAQWRIGSFLVNDLMTEEEKNRDITIAVIDDAIDQNHEAFKNVLTFVNNPMNGGTKNSHGSKVSSIFCSEAPCSVGVAKGTKLLFYSYEQQGFSSSNYHRSVKEEVADAINKGARIINMSIMHFQPITDIDQLEILQLIAAKDVAIVWAAGNDASENIKIQLPHENLIPVSSVNPFLKVSSFSNYGQDIEFSVPSDSFIHALDNSQFGGTSGAAPVLSGVILNILKVNPLLTIKEVKKILKISAFDLEETGWDEKTGWGMPNLPAAIYLTRLVREGKFLFSDNLAQDRLKLKGLLAKEIQSLTYKEVLKSNHYIDGIKKLFLNYFYDDSPQNRMQIYLFYRTHGFDISAAFYRDDRSIKKEILKKSFQNLDGFYGNKESEDLLILIAQVLQPFGFDEDIFNIATNYLSKDNKDGQLIGIHLLGYMPHKRTEEVLKNFIHDEISEDMVDIIVIGDISELSLRAEVIKSLTQIRCLDIIEIIRKDIKRLYSLTKHNQSQASDYYIQTALLSLAKLNTKESNEEITFFFKNDLYQMGMNRTIYVDPLKRWAENNKNILLNLMAHNDGFNSDMNSLVSLALLNEWTPEDIQPLLNCLLRTLEKNGDINGILYALGTIGNDNQALLNVLESFLHGRSYTNELLPEDRVKKIRQASAFALGETMIRHKTNLLDKIAPILTYVLDDPDPKVAEIASYFVNQASELEGTLDSSGNYFGRSGTHQLILDKDHVIFVQSQALDLNNYTGKKVKIHGEWKMGKTLGSSVKKPVFVIDNIQSQPIGGVK